LSIEPASIQAGHCYLTTNGQVRRVLRLLPDGRVQYEFRNGAVARALGWKAGVLDLRSFAFLAERVVPYDWTPEQDR
jgi:hypothetical protein